MLHERYQRRATAINKYVEKRDDMRPLLLAHFDVVLQAVATGRRELIRLHRTGEIDDATMRELERDLDLEELSAFRMRTLRLGVPLAVWWPSARTRAIR